jgi:anti-sigma B factor antagonist
MTDTAFGDFVVVTGGGVARIVVACEVDLANGRTFRRHVEQALTVPGIATVVVDFERCTHLDSAGLHVLFDASAQARNEGRSLTVVGAHGIVRRLIEVLDVDRAIALTG